MGKIHLTSAMNERDTMAEIRSVFSKAMKNDPCFEFSILYPIGGGSKSPTVPKTCGVQKKCARRLERGQSIFWPKPTWLRSQSWAISLTMGVLKIVSAIYTVD